MKAKKPRQPKDQRYPLMLPMLRTLDLKACAELQFHPTRKWRADFALPTWKILIEIDGGVWSGGRHTRGAGFVGDCHKINAAGILGWCVLRYQPKDCLAAGLAQIYDDIKATINNRGLF